MGGGTSSGQCGHWATICQRLLTLPESQSPSSAPFPITMNRLHREVLLGKNMCCESDPPHYTLRFLAPRWQFIVSKLRKLIA